MERMLSQNWGKAEYTVADWAGDWAREMAREQGQAARNTMKHMDALEALAGLGWLGTRMGQIFASAWDEVSEWFSRVTEDDTITPKTEAGNDREDKEYEIVMTDSGYARKYADGRYEYIDDVTARAEMYKETYGGEIVLTSYQNNKDKAGFNPDRIREVRELHEDGSYKVTIFDKEGKVAQQYYEVKK
ncbi:MAG: hypothetical protein WBK20_09910 [Spirochaetota bacterium]